MSGLEYEGFICPYCLVGFGSQGQLQSHFLDMHSGQGQVDHDDYDVVEYVEEEVSVCMHCVRCSSGMCDIPIMRWVIEHEQSPITVTMASSALDITMNILCFVFIDFAILKFLGTTL